MKYILLLFALFCCGLSYSQAIDTSFTSYEGTKLYHIKGESNTKALIFLHGGVKNPIFDDTAKTFDLAFLLGNNKSFVLAALENGFDLIVPITNDSMNWVDNHQYCFDVLTAYLNSVETYEVSYISGFSDGGTGSYRIFYNNSDYFDGLLAFNGYPQHQHFYKSVDYASITDKRIIFAGTFEDKRIPYEYNLTEYCRQKKFNPNTYLYVRDGGHSFGVYDFTENDLFFDVITGKTNCVKTEPIQGLLKEDQLVEFYPYHKKIAKKYGYGQEFYLINKEQSKLYKGK